VTFELTKHCICPCSMLNTVRSATRR